MYKKKKKKKKKRTNLWYKSATRKYPNILPTTLDMVMNWTNYACCIVLVYHHVVPSVCYLLVIRSVVYAHKFPTKNRYGHKFDELHDSTVPECISKL